MRVTPPAIDGSERTVGSEALAVVRLRRLVPGGREKPACVGNG